MNRVVKFGAVLALGLVFVGCSSKPLVIQDKNSGLTAIKINNGAGSPSWGANEKASTIDALQVAADATLSQNKSYFYIVKPDDISNEKGSMMNTAKEYIEKCTPSSGLMLNVGGAGLHKCGVAYNTKAMLVIKIVDSQTNEIITYNAKDVVDYLKANGIYDDGKKSVDLKGN